MTIGKLNRIFRLLLFSLLSISILLIISKVEYFSAKSGAMNNYEIKGDRQGIVTVKDTSGKVIRTFQMERDSVVREVFLLEEGKVVVASQKDHAIFWDLKTGQEIKRFPQRIYGFSDKEKQFLTYDEGSVFLYNYPAGKLTCKFSNPSQGIEKFIFSPNERFLAVLFATGRPESDEYYPNTGPLRSSIRYSKLFDLSNCQENQEFSKLRVFQLGKFSQNSQFYEIENYPFYVESESGYVTSTWRFNLATNKLEKVSNYR